jgi:MFS-type transporter involved in bile tolerance (Atg22 family)
MTAKSTSNIERIRAGYKGRLTMVKNEYKRKILGILLLAVFGIVGIIVGPYLENTIGVSPIGTMLIFVLIGVIINCLLGLFR